MDGKYIVVSENNVPVGQVNVENFSNVTIKAVHSVNISVPEVEKPVVPVTPVPPDEKDPPLIKSGAMSLNNQKGRTISGLNFEGLSTDALKLDNCENITIQFCTFKNIKGEAIRINRSKNVTIVDCKFDTIRTGMYATSSDNVKVSYSNFKNVMGPKPRGQSAQWNGCRGGYFGYCISQKTNSTAKVEDWVSIYKTSGNNKDDPFVVEHSVFIGGGPSSSGSAVMMFDNYGAFGVVRNNWIWNTGNVGIGLLGQHMVCRDNNVFSKQSSISNIAIYSGLKGESQAKDHLITGNRVNWKNKQNNQNFFWKYQTALDIRVEGNQVNVPWIEPYVPTGIGARF